MIRTARLTAAAALLALLAAPALAQTPAQPPAPAAAPAPAPEDPYRATIANFRKATQSRPFFDTAAGYAVFPTIGKGGAVVGGAFGRGARVARGRWIGNVTMTQLSLGFQLGGQGFSQIVFFETADALKRFTEGPFEFGVDASAVAVTLAATAKASSTGATVGASVDPNTAATVGTYNNGMATFTLVKGGLMYEVGVAGQKFRYTPR
jgi:lipid-binding SYLF domain-containing protein